MKKKIKIFENISEDKTLLGVSSHLKDFQIAWKLNKIFDFDFKKHNEELVSKNSNFNVFKYSDKLFDTKYCLLTNKTAEAVCVPEYGNIDYFLMLENVPSEKVSEIISELNKLKNIQGSFLLKFNKRLDEIFTILFEE